MTLTTLVCSEKGRGEMKGQKLGPGGHQADVVVVQSSSFFVSSARYVRKTWPASVQLHAPPYPPKSEKLSCCQLRVRPVAFGSRLGHCPVVISLVRSLLFTVSTSGAMATRRVLGGLGTRERSRGCAGAATPKTIGPSRSANCQGRIGLLGWFVRV